MAGVNKVIIVGRLGSDPEVKSVGTGSTVARLSVATSDQWTDNQGHKQERTEWHRIVLWNKLAELAGKYLEKGRQVYIEGRLQTRSWEDQQGQKRYTTEIVGTTIQFLGARPEGSNQSEQTEFEDYGPEPTFDSNDDIPY